MTEAGLTQAELARQMNTEILRLTGSAGTISERTVYNLLAGVHSRPHGKTLAALTAVFGCTAEELGFVSPDACRPARSEDPVDRRTFLASGTAAAAGAVLPPVCRSRPNVGASDVLRARAGLATLDALDDHRGGQGELERAALAGARQALDLQQGSASERVRRRLFGVVAEFTGLAPVLDKLTAAGAGR